MAKAKQERINVNPFAHLPIWLNSVNILWCVHCIALPVWGGGGSKPAPVNPLPSNPLTVQLLIFEQQQQLWKSQIAHFVQLHFVVCENYKLLVKKALNKCAKILEKCTQRKLKALPLPLCLLILLHTSLCGSGVRVVCGFWLFGQFRRKLLYLSCALTRTHIHSNVTSV